MTIDDQLMKELSRAKSKRKGDTKFNERRAYNLAKIANFGGNGERVYSDDASQEGGRFRLGAHSGPTSGHPPISFDLLCDQEGPDFEYQFGQVYEPKTELGSKPAQCLNLMFSQGFGIQLAAWITSRFSRNVYVELVKFVKLNFEQLLEFKEEQQTSGTSPLSISKQISIIRGFEESPVWVPLPDAAFKDLVNCGCFRLW